MIFATNDEKYLSLIRVEHIHSTAQPIRFIYGLYVATLLAQNPLTLAFEVAMERNREVVALVPDSHRVADHLSRDLGLPLAAD